ncbi:alpha/beta-hydrolase [Suhomyces tanzawaensis NRRL Y-17324]|uniref:triacylglycerol lipase n=1 Tax=Suhomyces tanzawaensis NRRL Y-17324 TaxID=984487 RepID=A0A1E4SQJ5_9ASCO|nr:alpha/beta-hydrolase [Suhomyces tanzawaensis NRRL Y-17324]ODV81783.1 alpha/beta-hydrolase [Suhomyces tanzawaensis NRRL Y-17324]
MRLPQLILRLWPILGPFPVPNDSVVPQPKALPVDPQVHSNLFTYAHLADIAYCISKTNHITEPFKCDLNCEKRFPNVTLVHQWYVDDTACGYVAVTDSNVFDYEEEASLPKRTVIVSLRGTRSIFDTYTDVKVDMVTYTNLMYNLPRCVDCRVHKGFYEAFAKTLNIVHNLLEDQIRGQDYELIFVGHSMGGSIALFLALYYLDLGYENISLVTFGQPLTGNQRFVNWADNALGSQFPASHNSFARKYLRVVHKDDVVATIPKSRNPLDSYYQFDNQIYLNCSAADATPSPEQVVDCLTGENPNCIRGDFQDGIDGILGGVNKNYYRSHNTYLRSIGLCGII